MQQRDRGFTLIELAIVLVILGLLVGGILVGQTLIRNAGLRSVVTESRGYQVAFSAFKDKYFAIPGDMKNAVKFWGAQAGGDADGIDNACMFSYDPATDAATCNGDGDGEIGGANYNETFRAWQQLGNAGLVEGGFIGVNSPNHGGAKYAEAGVNVPKSRLDGGGWSLWYLGTQDGSGAWYESNYGNAIIFGESDAVGLRTTPLITSVDAAHIDTKADDGYPNTGRVFSRTYSDQPDCAASTDDIYTKEDSIRGCSLVFLSGY